MIEFRCFGHKNILGTHKTTLEFTKDSEISTRADCIIGVNSDFDAKVLHNILGEKEIIVQILVGGIEEKIICSPNKKFNDKKELVIRLGSFDSGRTLGINSTKASIHLNRKIINLMKNPSQIMIVRIYPCPKSS